MTKHATKPIKVGVLFSTSGVISVMETSMRNATLFSIDQVNAAGGINGRELVPVQYDPASDPDKYKLFADRMLTEDAVQIIFGCYMSSSRKAVLPVVERRNALLCYPAQYEGFEYSHNIIYFGAAPNQNSRPLGNYLLDNVGSHFYIVGSDYIWPLESARIMSEMVRENGGYIAGECYLKLHAERELFNDLVKDIKRNNPAIIFCNFVGESIGHFYRAYADAGLDPAVMPIASLTTSETDIQAMGVEVGAGHITAAPYFQSIDTAQNLEFVTRFKKRYGADAVTDMCCEAAYNQVQIVADALRRANSDDIDFLRPKILGTEFHAPQGRIRIDESTAHTYLWPRIGRAQSDGQFEILQESENSVKPDPYLTSFNPNEWGARMATRSHR